MNFTLSCHAAYEYKQGRDFYENEKRLFLVLALVLTLLTSAVVLGEGQPQPKVPKYVFAFIGDGGYLSVMMIYMAQGTPLLSIFNSKTIATEILHTFVGCIGLILVCPFTAAIFCLRFKK